MRFTYEFEFFKGGSELLAVPFDFEGGTSGVDQREAAEMAADWLVETVNDCLLQKKELPTPTFGNQPKNDGQVAIISVDTSLDAIPTIFACDAAEKLGVSRARVSQLINEGLLDGYKKGRTTYVTVDSIEARIKDKPKAGRPTLNNAKKEEAVAKELDATTSFVALSDSFDESIRKMVESFTVPLIDADVINKMISIIEPIDYSAYFSAITKSYSSLLDHFIISSSDVKNSEGAELSTTTLSPYEPQRFKFRMIQGGKSHSSAFGYSGEKTDALEDRLEM